MADENIVTNIVAKSDFSNLIADLNKVSSALIKLQDQLQSTNKTLAVQADAINRNFASTLRSTGQFSTHFVSLSSDVDKFGMQLEKGQIKLRQFFRVYNEHSRTTGGLIRDLAKQQVQLQNAVLQPLGRNAEGLMQYNVNIPRGLDLIKNKTAIAKQELQIMNRVVQEGANQLINWGKNTQWAGRQLTVGLTIPLAAFGKAAADAFRTADEQLVRLTKVYGGIAPTTSAELMKVRKDVVDTAKEISKTMGASFNETIGLAADIAATGKTGNELLGSIQETTRLAVLGEVDRQEAMKATLAIQSAFNANTEELANTINFLNAVENQTSTTLSDLVEAIPKAGPVVKGLGGDVKDLALYLTAMREGGINAAEAANAIKSSLASLINPTKVATAMFADFGIDLKGIVAQNAGNLTKTILTLQAALDTLNPLQKQQALEQLFGKFQFARINALFENLGRQGSQTLQVLDLMKASSSDLANIAGRELTQVTESASGRYRRAIEGLKADLAGVGDQFLTINTHLINFIDGILKFVQALPKPIKSVLSFMGMLVAGAGPIIMLTGVLGNFFGYVIKGASHFRSLFKGGEGWKLLTPEILAAQKAGSLVEQTFYSDAQAAAVLKTAIQNLAAEYQVLATASQKAAVSTNPTVSTTGGTMVIPGRVVNPQNKFVGEYGTRAATHMNPVAGMTAEQKTAQTIFGVVPGPIPVNRRIGANPQIMAAGELPVIPGLTQISGVSTGVVASEAAKWHSMMGMLSMLSKREVAQLKKEITLTGTMSQEFIQTYSTLHPVISQITQNAAQESQLILAQLQAGKLTVDQARAQIIAVNAQMETLMAQSTSQVAQSLGRTAEMTSVPLINQPIVSAAGKSNIKELFRKGRPVSGIIDKIARALGVRTYGAGYSTETTIPKRMATGGVVYKATAGQVDSHPGSPRGTDTVPAWLTEGEFVVNKEATASNLPLLRAINNSSKSAIPNRRINTESPRLQRTHITDDLSGLALLLPDWVNQEINSARGGLTGRQIANGIRDVLSRSKYNPNDLFIQSASTLGGDVNQATRRTGIALNQLLTALESEHNRDRIIGGRTNPFGFERLAKQIYAPALRGIRINPSMAGGIANLYGAISQIFSVRSQKKLTKDEAINRGIISGKLTGSSSMGQIVTRSSGRLTWLRAGQNIGTRMPDWARGTALESLLTTGRGIQAAKSAIKYRSVGGEALNYNNGGMVSGVNYLENGGGPIQAFTQGLRNPYGKGLIKGVGQPMGMGAQIGIGLAGSAAGSMIGGPLGMGIMIASNILPLMTGLSKGVGLATNLAGILGRLTIPGAVIGTIAILGKLILDAKKKAEDLGKANRLAMGGTASSFASVGVKNYKSLTDRFKELNEQMELNKAKAQSLYESYTKAGPSGITLTITQLKDAVKNATENQKEYVNAFNRLKEGQVVEYATKLKAQFVAMGLSASDAANQIYAIIKASDKAGQALQAVSSAGFGKIVNQTTALEALFNNLSKASTLKNFNAEEFAQGIDTITNAIMAYQDVLRQPNKQTGQTLTEAEVLQKTMEKIQSIQKSGVTLGAQQVEKLKEQNIVYAAILGNAESLQSILAKTLIYNQGLGNIVDLSKMSGAQAIDFANNLKEVQAGIEQVFNDKNGLGGQGLTDAITKANTATKKYQDQVKALQKVDSSYYDQKLKAIDKEIKKINELADARIKALQQEADAEDYNIQLQKKRLEYQDALAAGDMSAAAQAQLDIRNLQKQKSLKDTISTIDEKRNAEVKAQQAQAEKIKEEQDRMSVAAQTATAKATQSVANAQELQGYKNSIENLILRYKGGEKGIEKELALVLQNLSKSSNTEAKKLYKSLVEKYGYGTGGASGTLEATASGMLNKFDEILKTSEYGSFKTAVDKFVDAVNKFSGTTDAEGKKKDVIGSMTASKTPGTSYIKEKYLSNAGYSTDTGTIFPFAGKNYEVVRKNDDGTLTVVEKKAMGGYIKRYAQAGFVSGPGTGTSDSIPAYLSNGEYVVRAAAVSKVGVPFLDNINKMANGGLASYDIPSSRRYGMLGSSKTNNIRTFNMGGLVMHFAGGGEVDGRKIYADMMQAAREQEYKVTSGRLLGSGAA